jgi:hypothetical protein
MHSSGEKDSITFIKLFAKIVKKGTINGYIEEWSNLRIYAGLKRNRSRSRKIFIYHYISNQSEAHNQDTENHGRESDVFRNFEFIVVGAVLVR